MNKYGAKWLFFFCLPIPVKPKWTDCMSKFTPHISTVPSLSKMLRKSVCSLFSSFFFFVFGCCIRDKPSFSRCVCVRHTLAASKVCKHSFFLSMLLWDGRLRFCRRSWAEVCSAAGVLTWAAVSVDFSCFSFAAVKLTSAVCPWQQWRLPEHKHVCVYALKQTFYLLGNNDFKEYFTYTHKQPESQQRPF